TGGARANEAADPVAEGHGPGDLRRAGPRGAGDDVFAVGERPHATEADRVAGLAADEAVGVGDHAADAAHAAAERHRPGIARPVGADHDVIAVAQQYEVAVEAAVLIADEVIGMAAD